MNNSDSQMGFVQTFTNFFNILPPRQRANTAHPYQANPGQALSRLETQFFSIKYRKEQINEICQEEKLKAVAFYKNENQKDAVIAYKKHRLAEKELYQLN